MTKILAQCQAAIDAADAVLADAEVTHPRDIRLRAIVGKNGGNILYGPTATSKGNIVRAGKHAIIYVDETARGTLRERTTLAHEVGHMKMHGLADHFEQCEPSEERRSGTDWRIEGEAYDFGRALMAPAWLAAAYATALRPSLDDVERVARVFRMSLEVTFIRYVQLADAAGIACAGVLTTPSGRIKWAPETRAFPGRIVKKRALHEGSFAARVLATKKDRGGVEREVPGAAWGGKAPFVEQSIHLGGSGGVLSWIVPA